MIYKQNNLTTSGALQSDGTTTNSTLDGVTLKPERERIDAMFFDYLELRRRQIINELRNVEGHLLKAGRIKRPSLPPVKQR